MTSRFCDYRAGHFHAGLDIRTNGKTGYRVYAVDDGYILRASASYSGYGKALYLKLNDGRIAVYGHLLGFEKEVAERIREVQTKDKRYRQDLYFEAGQLPVKKGQVVGLSGASGSGAPHLHFEMRSPGNNPVNPLKSGFGIEDRRPPEFDRLAARVFAGDFEPGVPSHLEIIDPVKAGRDYVIPDTLLVDGCLVLAVSGGDKIDERGYLYGFYSLELFVDDSLVFSSTADSLTYQSTRQQEYLRDMELSRLGGPINGQDNDENIFHKLYIPPGAKQYFWGDGEKTGVIPPGTVPGQIRTFEITASDEAGNLSRLKGVLASPGLAAPRPEFISYYRFGDTLEVDFLTPDSVGSWWVQYRSSPDSRFKSIRCTRQSQTWEGAGTAAYLNTVKAVSPNRSGDYRISFADIGGNFSPWIYFVDGSGKKNVFELKGSPDHLRLEYFPESIRATLNIRVLNRSRSVDKMMSQGGINAFYFDIIDESLKGETRFTIRDESAVLIDTVLILYPAAAGKAVTAYSPDSSLTLIAGEQTMYYSTYIFPSAGMTARVLGGDAIIYNIEPADLPADDPFIFRFDLRRLSLAGKNIGVYGYAPLADKWGFIGTNDGPEIEVKGFGLGKLALVEDNDPPIIGSIGPAGTTRSGKPLLSCVIDDLISGISLENPPDMLVDGIWVPAEYDMDTKEFSYRVRNNLKRGKHSLEIRVYDKQGNKKTSSTFFTIDGRQ